MYEIKILTDSLPEGKKGRGYAVILKAKTFPPTNKIKWRCLNSLPLGLSLNERTGELSGTCQTSYLATITLCVERMDSGDTSYKRFQLRVTEESPKPESDKLQIVLEKFGSLTVGQQFFMNLKAKGGKPPYLWTVENLPLGLYLRGDTIQGVPQMGGGQFPLEIHVFDQSKSTDTYFCWLIINN